MTSRLRITFGFLAMTAAISGVGCGATEPGDQSASAAKGGTGASAGGTSAQAGSTTGPVGQVGTLGESCGTAGALACAGNYQKLTLVCGADGKWQTNTTCTGDQLCDTQGTLTAGTCMSPDPVCVGLQPAQQICVNNDIYACGPDTISKNLVSSCPVWCKNGACQEADACPTPSDTVRVASCSTECGGPSSYCGGSCLAIVPYAPPLGGMQILRLPGAADMNTCTCTGSDRRVFQFDIMDDFSGDFARISVGEPWWIGEPYAWTTGRDLSVNRDPCVETGVRQCVVIPDYGQDARVTVRIITDNPSAPARNVSVEHVPAGSTCP